MKRLGLAVACVLGLMAQRGLAFEIDFTWAGLKLCTTGNPNRVANPAFALSGVPEGTKFLRFKLVDLDVPGYDHGGGIVAYSGQTTIGPGAFKYESPCPPNGTHTYEWRASAQSRRNGGVIATTATQRPYP